MNLTHYYIEVAGGGLQPAMPARIVCYGEGGGAWTIEMQNADGSPIRDERCNYVAVWNDEEAHDDFQPMSREEAIAAAVALAADVGLPTLPVYMDEDGGLALVAGGAR